MIPCPLYCYRIAVHALTWIWLERCDNNNPEWWEIEHYWYSKVYLKTLTIS